MKGIAFAMVALLLSSGAIAASNATSDYEKALSKAIAPCQVMTFQANLDQQNARLSAQMNGTMSEYIDKLSNSKPDPALIACYRNARVNGAEAYKTFVATTKSEAVKKSAKNVLSAWLAYVDVTTDGTSDSDQNSPEAVALRKAESDLEVEVMTE